MMRSTQKLEDHENPGDAYDETTFPGSQAKMEVVMKTLTLALIATAFLSVGFAESAFARTSFFHRNLGANHHVITNKHPAGAGLRLDPNRRHNRSIRGHEGHI
jgi:hypothetical protein